MENKLVKISLLTMIISIVLILIAIFVFVKPVFALALAILYLSNAQSILLLLSGVMIVSGAVYITYRYLLYIINYFKTKKVKTILMVVIPIVLLTILGIIYRKEETFSSAIIMPSLYILTVIVIPIIIIGMILLRDIKKVQKVIATIIIVILTIGIYVINYPYLKLFAEELLPDIGQFIEAKTESKQEIDGQATEYNLVYLENYKQKMEKEGFLDKYDILNILKLADSRTDNIQVHYTEGTEEVQLNNVDNQLVEELGPKLKANTYKFSYTHKNGQTDIYIEKYENQQTENTEKNQDITINGLPSEEITNIKKIYETKDADNFTFENKVNVPIGQETELDNLRILFVYDEEQDNYIPYVENSGELKKIESYKIYSTGMSITLKSGIKLNKEDYTIIVNRYDEDLKVKEEKDGYYYYKFEPVATQLRDSDNRTVIEFKFGNTYTIHHLKNIEIIF